MRNGNRITLYTRSAVVSIAEAQDYKELYYDMKTMTWILSSLAYVKKNTVIKIGTNLDNGEVVAIFLKEMYGKLPIRGRIVIDVASNIGDSAIYFALRGASKVISIEPFFKSHDTAPKNIELNNLQQKIILLLAGCTGKEKRTKQYSSKCTSGSII